MADFENENEDQDEDQDEDLDEDEDEDQDANDGRVVWDGGDADDAIADEILDAEDEDVHADAEPLSPPPAPHFERLCANNAALFQDATIRVGTWSGDVRGILDAPTHDANADAAAAAAEPDAWVLRFACGTVVHITSRGWDPYLVSSNNSHADYVGQLLTSVLRGAGRFRKRGRQ